MEPHHTIKLTCLHRTEVTADFMVSIWIEVGENERQLLAFMELNGSEICDMIGSLYGELLFIFFGTQTNSLDRNTDDS
jgi:hypothetical protein